MRKKLHPLDRTPRKLVGLVLPGFAHHKARRFQVLPATTSACRLWGRVVALDGQPPRLVSYRKGADSPAGVLTRRYVAESDCRDVQPNGFLCALKEV